MVDCKSSRCTAVPEAVGWDVEMRCHSLRGFWKGRINAGPREEVLKEEAQIHTLHLDIYK